MRIHDLNNLRPWHKRLAVDLFRFALLLAIGIGFYYMTKGV